MTFEGTDSGSLRLPTFRQYCKEALPGDCKPARIVKTIWLPNQYPSLTLETEKFRLRIAEGSKGYDDLIEWTKDQVDDQAVIAIWVVSAEKFAYRIDTLPGEVAVYRALGEFGIALESVSKPKKRSKRDSQEAVEGVHVNPEPLGGSARALNEP